MPKVQTLSWTQRLRGERVENSRYFESLIRSSHGQTIVPKIATHDGVTAASAVQVVVLCATVGNREMVFSVKLMDD